ncbi:TPR repeat protein, SEL1 subfamily [Mannheimia sp. USDA-ARS-USMARC-1261]|uniref:sel1 repeat family protein n=1 Tax=Mannheimia sp. USDA-ARS-USMARC-1261 TaxID=1432056 RepID=UPI0003E370B9|nr:sel1 repeat family protein [Mannheimia sp. USDA-ARS-USMARC-1261]AHG72671.1 TPR repeat protein, SEL1 subfamily [Mannheimia sp. USDA-ARS-USMARC-1261]
MGRKEIKDTAEATILKKNIERILKNLGLENKWKKIASDLLDDFCQKGEYKKNDVRSLDKLADRIKTNLSYKKRNNTKFLTELYRSLCNLEEVKKLDIPNFDTSESGDSISDLCKKYLKNFLERKFEIPKPDLDILIKNAHMGHTLARRTLGDYYLYGGNLGIPNFIEAHHYYTFAIEDNCYISAYQLGQMYENKNGFFNHIAIAYKYYELSLQFYFIKLAQCMVNKRDFPNFPNVFSKVAYYAGYLKNEHDDQTFYAMSYLGYKEGDKVCSLFLAYSLLIGKGIDENLDLAIEIYKEMIANGIKTHSDLIALSCLALIYRDILNDVELYSKYKNLFVDLYPNLSDEEIVFRMENTIFEINPRMIMSYISTKNKDLWNCNNQFQSSHFEFLSSVDKIIHKERNHNNLKFKQTVRLEFKN